MLTPASPPGHSAETELSAQEHAEIRQAATRRMAVHSRRGLPAFPLAFGIAASVAGGQLIQPLVIGLILVGLLATAWRAYLVSGFEEQYPLAPEGWRRKFRFGLLISVLAWSSLTGWMVTTTDLAASSFLLLLISVALMGQSMIMYAQDLRLVVGYLLAMTTPIFIGMLWTQSTIGWVAAGGVVVYTAYCWFSGRSLHHKLWRGLVDARLLSRRANELEQARDSLRQSRDDLEAQVRERTADIQRVTESLQQREQNYRTIFDNAHDAIVIFNLETQVILNVNRRACEIYGYGAHDLVGMEMKRLTVDQEARRKNIALTRQFGERHNFESQHRRSDDCEIQVEINASRIEYAGQQAILSIIRDITERKRAEALYLAKETAERASQAKSEFLANMSHEIRTPMAGVIGLASLMLKGELAERERHFAQTIQASSESLLEVIDDILDFSKIEAGKLSLDQAPFRLRDMVQRLFELLRPKAVAQGIRLTAKVDDEVPDALVGASARLRQILLNLLGNSLKFTEEGSIELTVSRTSARPAVGLRFTVQDSGMGIDEALQETLFEPFTQADTSTARRYDGSGLGLAICKRLVALMGGELGFDSTPGQGTVFWLELEFELAAGPVSEDSDLPAELAEPLGGRILVAEDNPVNQMVILEQLTSLGFTAEAVGNGHEAVAAVAKQSFDLVLMDCQMPELDGYQASQQIRQLAEPAGLIPIIALTAHAMAGDRERCLAMGMDDYISKPFSERRLVLTLERWLRRRK